MTVLRQTTALFLVCSLVVATCPLESIAQSSQAATAKQPTGQSTERLEQLVAPIALYPDALVAQILAGATYPTQIVEADRWLQQNPNLQGEKLGTAVDAQPWDESVKALIQFPSVLDNMSKNLSWTSALGDAYFNDQESVGAAIQKLRKQAKDAGNLKTTKEQTVTAQAQTIIIQPASPQVVYVPVYNPTVVYGAPVAVYPGYSSADMAAAAIISFGVGMAVGAAVWGGGCCRWGWNSWGYNWHGGSVVYQRNVYVSRSNVYVNRNSYYRNPNNYPRPTPYGGNTNINRNGNNNINRSGNNNMNRSGNTINGGGNTINRGGGNTVNVNPGGNKNGSATTLPAGNRGNMQGNTGGKTPATPSTLPAGNRGNVQGNQGQGQNRPQADPNRGYGQNRDSGTRSNAFSGYTAGGNAAAQQSRGSSSLGGGGGAARSGGRTGGGRR
ncbi:MAG TPA: DUF3300 domain-containing protein [Terriglobales bacterium]|nr:DUF3300 domain-containing protein [Terriglobales bacterium]